MDHYSQMHSEMSSKPTQQQLLLEDELKTLRAELALIRQQERRHRVSPLKQKSLNQLNASQSSESPSPLSVMAGLSCVS